MNTQLFLQFNTIFISILIEALPFILLAVIISALIQLWVTDEMLAKLIPKNRFLSVLTATSLGAVFPACECGIIPVTQRLMAKGVPLHAAVAFMLTGPVINPVVLFSTYVAFGNSWKMVFLRGGLSFAVALVVGLILSYQFKGVSQLKHTLQSRKMPENSTTKNKVLGTVKHMIDEFFSVGKYLVAGALIAALMQTYLKTSVFTSIGNGDASASLVMMALAFILSLCSSADAFVAASFRSTFSTGALIAFLVFGAKFDIKNTMMMLGVFKTKFVFYLFIYTAALVFIGSMIITFLQL
ncbi:permease [Sporosarcina sp. BI001-red]|uniref:permease n=1 Tax=Sporosarcina sp. BI001-red TaxID=2282866 RepID=UPI000E277066|nr:permease [Sporosarcina sp. BI001-red]REB04711.1 permease [Sporosarcina sp. BI001-red]